MKILVHVGLPKTGTTSIQSFLVKNTSILQQFGVYYPSEGLDPEIESNGNAYPIFQIANHPDKRERRDLLVCYVRDIVNNARFKDCNCIILSSETISTLSKEGILNLVDAINQLKLKIDMICYTREPYEWLFSSWLQSIKRQGNTKWLYDSVIENPDFSLSPLVFNNFITSIADNVNMLTIDYTEAIKNDQLVSSFVNLLPCGTDILKFSASNKVFKNRSLGKFETFFILYLNRLTDGELIPFDLSINDAYDFHDDKLFFYDKRVAEKIAEYLSANNISYTPKAYVDEGDCSESVIFETINRRDKYLLELIKKHGSYITNRLDIFRENLIEKARFYFDSPYKQQVDLEFDVISYLTLNSDVYQQEIDPYEHYVKYGRSEGRLINGKNLPFDDM